MLSLRGVSLPEKVTDGRNGQENGVKRSSHHNYNHIWSCDILGCDDLTLTMVKRDNFTTKGKSQLKKFL